MLLFSIIIILIMIILIVIFRKLAKQPNKKKNGSNFEDKFVQIQDDLIKQASDAYNNIYNRIVPDKDPINCNQTLYWIKDNVFYSIIQYDTYISDIKEKLDKQKYNVVYNSKIPQINFTYDEIPIKNIKYFTKEGDIQHSTVVSGGGGGGSSISGAVIGGVLAGGAGAIIGSRKKIDEIQSKIVENDIRKTILKFYRDGNIVSREYDYQVFNVFEELIPDKEYNIVIQSEVQKNIKSTNNDIDIENSLKKLKHLRENDLIDEFDYQQKKKEVLDML